MRWMQIRPNCFIKLAIFVIVKRLGCVFVFRADICTPFVCLPHPVHLRFGHLKWVLPPSVE